MDALQRRSPLRIATAYGGAAAAALAAIGLRWLLEPWLGADAPYILVFGAVALAVWLGGAGPAVLAAVLGYTLINLLYVEPRGALSIARAKDLIQLVLFSLACALVIGLGYAMRRARDRSRRSDLKKSEFLALLSHELRNPLAPLRTAAEILKLKPDEAPAPALTQMMQRQIAHLTRLIDDLLDLSRIDQGKLELRTELVALDSVVRSALETAMPGIEAKSHRIAVRSAGQPLYVEGDAVRLAQVLSNLLNNAAKFTPRGGSIELAVHADEGTATISVADNGIGLAPEHLEKVFDMFTQVQPGSAAGGLGLGLTLARWIVRRHGGELEARSEGVGRGAQFVVRLPLAPAPAAEASPAPAPAIAPAPGRRVLVVDDNADAAHALGELLRLQGHRVDVALDADTALRAARLSPPEVAFIDLNMPGADGFELARRLRNALDGHGISLVALTGMGQRADMVRTREAGFQAHLTKPADPQAVARLILDSGAAIVEARSDVA